LIVGVSAGSFVGAFYAAGYRAEELEQLALGVERKELVDYSLGWFGLIKGQALQEYVNEHLNRRPMEALQIPFAVVVTDFQTGRLKVLNRGDTGIAVRASSSIPGLFHPVVIDGRRYVDGSLVSPIPVCVARQMGADFVIAVDVWYAPHQTSIDNPLNIPFQTIHIMAQALSAHQIQAADVAVKPKIGGDVSFDEAGADSSRRRGCVGGVAGNQGAASGRKTLAPSGLGESLSTDELNSRIDHCFQRGLNETKQRTGY
jgi:NTE family protein